VSEQATPLTALPTVRAGRRDCIPYGGQHLCLHSPTRPLGNQQVAGLYKRSSPPSDPLPPTRTPEAPCLMLVSWIVEQDGIEPSTYEAITSAACLPHTGTPHK